MNANYFLKVWKTPSEEFILLANKNDITPKWEVFKLTTELRSRPEVPDEVRRDADIIYMC